MESRKKRYLIAGLTCLVLIALIFTSSRSGVTSDIQGKLGAVSKPIHSSIAFVYGKVNDFSDFLFGSKEMRDNYKRLELENKELKKDLAVKDEIISSKEYLKNEYELIEATDYDLTPAYVIAESPTDLMDYYNINVGSKDGVKAGDIVVQGAKFTEKVYMEGLVGLVVQTGPNWARVRSIMSPDSSISFINSRTLDKGVINSQGQDGLKGYYFNAGAEAREGDKLLTSGLGGVFPNGIYIGEISRVNLSDKYDFQISVETSVDLDQVHRVYVMDVGELEDE